ncbi:MAG: NYN domain-containing protein [Candidatus Latescibacterota bacterium]|nr:MAG: NYN domain-containing protein [Candidatus Latescibacterota bacterium]
MIRSQKIIIDGYNVIYTDDRLRRIACRDMERAREEFLRVLEDYIKAKDIQVTVVFDGKGGMVEAEAVVPGKLQVVYSATGQSADDLILSVVEESGKARSYMVVTSDRAHIGGMAKRLGCEVLGSKRFLERLLKRTPESSKHRDEKPGQGNIDTDYWLGMFGTDGEGESSN